ncbi:MAG: class I SAM-dependent methyltransferase [Candidatus Aenigmarchaeota archaeon]|nr:class I SAM-dependent methyltransferase [Candidatus Aenigmarchaeota archaeon]
MRGNLKDFKGLNWLGRRLKKEQRKTLKKILDEIKIPKEAKVIDVGCGSGFTLTFFREFGYNDSIEIDLSRNSLAICKNYLILKMEKMFFLMDARNLMFPDNSFDLVFSEGLLEHFKDFTAIAKELYRASKSWILLFQPNQTSFFGRVKRFKEKFDRVSWEKEYFCKKEDYIKAFSKFGFRLVNFGGINFNEQVWLLSRG